MIDIFKREKWPRAFIKAGIILLVMMALVAVVDMLYYPPEVADGPQSCQNSFKNSTTCVNQNPFENNSLKNKISTRNLSPNEDHVTDNIPEYESDTISDIFDKFYLKLNLSTSSSLIHFTPEELQQHLEVEEAHDYYFEGISPVSVEEEVLRPFPFRKSKKATSQKTTKIFQRCFAISTDPNDVRFFLYGNKSNPNTSTELILNDTESVAESLFRPEAKTVLLVHGYYNNGTSTMPKTIINSYMNVGLPHNVIVVDWGNLSSPSNRRGCYVASYASVMKRSIPVVGQRIADFIQFLIDNNFTSLEKLHLVGFSLGAHISGWAGYVVQKSLWNEGRKIERITGLDPAGPLFGKFIKLQRRLNFEDAEFVDVYHTAAGVLNFGNYIRNIGHADFFPNGGKAQPGCPKLNRITSILCNHAFAFRLYAVSIQEDISGCRCDPAFYYLVKYCPGRCKEQSAVGEACPSNSSGQFYFTTGPITVLNTKDNNGTVSFVREPGKPDFNGTSSAMQLNIHENFPFMFIPVLLQILVLNCTN